MNRKFLVIVFALAASLAVAAVAPVFAKDFHVPEGAVRNYWTGGSGGIEVPTTDWPSGGIHRDYLVIYAQHVEAGSLGTGDSITIFIPYGTFILPMACFCTNADEASFEKALRAGTPAGNLAGNTRPVLESDLKVERHGNRITVELVAPQTILWPKTGGGLISAIIPAFTMELDEVDGSVHTYTELPVPSGYTVYDDNMGFSADGAFTCAAWGYVAKPMTGCFIVMHGINTNVPPPPP